MKFVFYVSHSSWSAIRRGASGAVGLLTKFYSVADSGNIFTASNLRKMLLMNADLRKRKCRISSH